MPPGVTDVVAHPTQRLEAVRERPHRHVVGREDPERRGREVRVQRATCPNLPGRVLVFPALVTYQDGKVVHWIGAESSDTPAPRVTLTAAAGQASLPLRRQLARQRRTSTASDGGGGNTLDLDRHRRGDHRRSVSAILVVRRRTRLKRSLLVAAVLAALLAPGAEAHFGTGKLGYRSTITGGRPSHARPAVQDPVRRRPGLARQPQRQDGDHQGLQRRAVPPLRPERDLRQHQVTGRLPEPGPLRARARFRSRRARRRSPSGRSSPAETSGPGTTTGSTT